MNFPYWPLLEYLIRSSHIGWATSSISSSLWSIMFICIKKGQREVPE